MGFGKIQTEISTEFLARDDRPERLAHVSLNAFAMLGMVCGCLPFPVLFHCPVLFFSFHFFNRSQGHIGLDRFAVDRSYLEYILWAAPLRQWSVSGAM